MDLLSDAAQRAARYLDALPERRVGPAPEAVEALAGFSEPLPADGCAPEEALALLDRLGSPATLATAGGRFFGFVIGGALPQTVAASWLASAWDQNAGLWVCSPTAGCLEDVALGWLADLAGLPAGTGGAFVTGATLANFTALAAARHAVLAAQGWDVEADGLFGAPPVRVVVGEEAHPTLTKAVAMLGLGRERVVRLPVDRQGRVRADSLPRLDGPSIVCLQAGNINTGAFDPMDVLVPEAREAGAWVHVDGAFGLWAAASPALAPLARGMALADSWATDAHKWLNVPYDSGLALLRDPEILRRAMSISAAYLPEEGRREPSHYTPELSRRARGIEIWMALKTLGRSGVAAMVERCCRHARRFAEGLAAAGYEILNDVVLNQVLVSFGSPERTRDVIARLQADGTCWCGGTVWQGHTAMRISVCSWATTEEDVERSLEAMLRIAAE
jgi:glutamate/tyrosine decarboxylase-like PLP-dependent enzyme